MARVTSGSLRAMAASFMGGGSQVLATAASFTGGGSQVLATAAGGS
jgi:hypothetical protein